MKDYIVENSILQSLSVPCIDEEFQFYIKRDDLIHPIVSGNKWRKLKHHIEAAKRAEKTHLVSFGGAYSNHMVALACAGASLGFKTTCFLRGEELKSDSNHYLKLAALYGMNLIPVTRAEYRDDKEALFQSHFGNDIHATCIAEGGAGLDGERGVAELITELPFEPDYIIHASATATTAKGIMLGLKNNNFTKTSLLAVPVLFNSAEQEFKIQEQAYPNSFRIITGFEAGGYAKSNPDLNDFIRKFISQTGILIDPIYNGKALFALKNLLLSGEISKDKKVVFLHTGGMLGAW